MNTKDLANAIIDMAEKDKGLVLSKLEDLIEAFKLDTGHDGPDQAYSQGYDDGFADASDAVQTGALVEVSEDLNEANLKRMRDMARAATTPEQRQEAANRTGQILAERAAYVRAQDEAGIGTLRATPLTCLLALPNGHKKATVDKREWDRLHNTAYDHLSKAYGMKSLQTDFIDCNYQMVMMATVEGKTATVRFDSTKPADPVLLADTLAKKLTN